MTSTVPSTPASGAARVSVVMPCHNYARFVGEAIASIVAQGPLVAEIVVVDDGSTDGSGDVAAAASPLVRVIRQDCQGIAAARNAGIAAARGELVAFLDADDILTDASLAVRVAALDARPELGCVFGRLAHFLCPALDDEARSRLFCPPDEAAARFAGTMVARADVFRTVGGFDPSLRVGEMIDWISRLEAAGVGIGAVDACVLRRRIHGANTVLQRPDDRSAYLHALKAALARKRA